MKPRQFFATALGLALLASALAWVRSPDEAQWPAGTVTMQLRLGTSSALSDGRTWDANAIEAMQVWNGCMRDLKFAWQQTGTMTGAARNGLNEVFFAGDVYGEAWGTRVLAVTVYWSSGKVRTEADVVFNRSLNWDAYRGYLHYAGGSGEAVPEFRRVALHELGHVLGLGHPDENGQYLYALMNSIMSDVDGLTEDDMDGIGALYGRGPNSQIPPPQILEQPVAQQCYVGDWVALYASATGRGLTCQWRKDGVDLPGETDWYLRFAAATLEDTGNYTFAVSNDEGTVVSNPARLTVSLPPLPVFSSHPSSQTVTDGASLNLYVWADGRYVTFQWKKDGVDIPRATNSSFDLRVVTMADAGVYTVVASNAAGSVVSNPATVTVMPAEPPRITSQPSGVTVEVGGSFYFSVGTVGSQPIAYQWYRDGSPIVGAIGSSLSVAAVTGAAEGAYTAKVKNIAGEATSAPALVHVVAKSLDRALKVFGGEVKVGSGFSISTSYSGAGDVSESYQWLRNGVAIRDMVSPYHFEIVGASAADAGEYQLVVTNSTGTIASIPGLVSVVSQTNSRDSLSTAELGAWLDIQECGGVVYLLYATPGRIERYDLNAGAWLPSVLLPATATAFRTDASGVYVAFGTRVSRFTTDLAAENPLAKTEQEILRLAVWSNRLWTFSGEWSGKAEVFDLPSGTRVSAADIGFYGLMPKVAVASNAGRLYGARRSGGMGYFPLAGDGTVGGFVDSPYHGELPSGVRVFLSPDEAVVADSGGVLYRTTDLTWVSGLGGAFQDCVFLPDGGAAILRGTRLHRLDNQWHESGVATVATVGDRMFLHGNDLVLFTQASSVGGTVGVTKATLASMTPRTAAAAVDATDLKYTPDEVTVDAAGTVYLSSRLHRNVFRWSSGERRYLAPATLSATQSLMTSVEAGGEIVVAYPDGRIAAVRFPDGVEAGLATTPRPVSALAMAGDSILAVNPSGSWARHYTLAADGTVQAELGTNYESSSYAWSAANRRMYYFKGSYSNGIHYEEIAANGVFGVSGDSSPLAAINCVPPIRVSPDGQLVVLGSGEIYSGSKLELVARLANSFDDAVWFGGTLTSIRRGLDDCELQQWSGVSFTQTSSAVLEGYPLRLAPLPDGQLLAVTLVRGRPRFHILNSLLKVAYQSSVTVPPAIGTSPASKSVTNGGSLNLAVVATGEGALAYQWYCNGAPIVGAVNAELSLANIDPSRAGLYDCTVSGQRGPTLTRPAVVGVLPPAGSRTAGEVTTRTEWQDIHHPNGNTYDQFLLHGPAGTFTADPGEIARMSYLDLNGSIVQVEMSGAGAITVVLDPATVRSFVLPQLYNQSGIYYAQGKATVILAGADETTHFTIYSVGTATNPGVTRPDVDYAGWADVASSGIVSTDGKLGGIHQGNVHYNASSGYVGLVAPTVRSVVGQPVVIHEIAAGGVALGELSFGSGGNVQVKIAGGSLAQPTGDPLVVDGLAKVTLGAGQDSCGRAAPAQAIGTRLVDPNDNDVTGSLVGP